MVVGTINSFTSPNFIERCGSEAFPFGLIYATTKASIGSSI